MVAVVVDGMRRSERVRNKRVWMRWDILTQELGWVAHDLTSNERDVLRVEHE